MSWIAFIVAVAFFATLALAPLFIGSEGENGR